MNNVLHVAYEVRINAPIQPSATSVYGRLLLGDTVLVEAVCPDDALSLEERLENVRNSILDHMAETINAAATVSTPDITEELRRVTSPQFAQAHRAANAQALRRIANEKR